MRTIFEDVDERADLEDDGKEKRTRSVFWLIALLSVGLAGGTYYWIKNRKPPEPPPLAASINDDNQLNTAANRFNSFVKAGNWEEAQKMISAEGLKRLEAENKSLRDSLLLTHSKDSVLEAGLTPSRSRTPSTARLDTAYIYANDVTQIIPLTFVVENGRLAINSW